MTANGGPYFGELIGRYANRIAKGRFALNQPGVGPVTYTVPINNGVNSLHGGLVGFGNHIWADQPVQGPGYVGVQLTLLSPNGDQAGAAGSPGCPDGCTGYPGEVQVVVTYTLNNDNQLGIHYLTRDESSNLNTVINLTNHSYFNLAGEDSPAGSAYGQFVQINANQYTPTDTTQLGAELTDAGHNRPRRAQPCGPGVRPGERPSADRVDRSAGRSAVHQQLPDRHAGRDQRSHLPAGRCLHIRDPALPELTQPAELPVHGTRRRKDIHHHDPSSSSPSNRRSTISSPAPGAHCAQRSGAAWCDWRRRRRCQGRRRGPALSRSRPRRHRSATCLGPGSGPVEHRARANGPGGIVLATPLNRQPVQSAGLPTSY